MTVYLVSPAMVESTAGVAVVRLLSCSSGYALTVSGLPTDQGSPIVDPSSDPVTCPVMLPDTLPVTIYVIFPTVRLLSVNPSGLHVYLIKR